MSLSDLDRTRRIQWEASDPAASAWVVANAGAGKTHVLTQRVIRLLLAGSDPAAILCLTYTKVAAAEMARRIFGLLAGWTTLPEAELAAQIEEQQGRPPSRAEMIAARRLFARTLETPGGLKIQTIHAFCERLLHQFPFEANVPGQFAVLDDTAAAALVSEARDAVMQDAAAAPEGRLGRAMRYLAEHASDQQIAAALDAVIAERDALRRWTELSEGMGEGGAIDDALADLRRRLNLAPGDTEAALCREICSAAGWERQHCARLIAELADALALAENAIDRVAHASLSALLAAGDEATEAELRLAFFLNRDSAGPNGRDPTRRFGAAFARERASLRDHFATETERLLALADRLVRARAYTATEALLVVGDAILQNYLAAKRQAALLDFSDMIVKARNLLSRADAAAWVLYKLDARIEHILVDEAQDTSPDQWAVVRAIAADFFSGATAAPGRRTIFAVGDDKQSIFGFQGAAPRMLAEMEHYFRRAVEQAEAPFVRRPLALSFRSTTEVLGAVDRVFSGERAESVTQSGYEAHVAQRQSEPGEVVILPRRVRATAEEPEDWTEPFDAPTAAEVALAGDVAAEIKRMIGTTLPSGKRVKAGEVLILVRRRDAFVSAVNRELRRQGIVTAGADRIPVATHVAVLDLLALADAVLLPDDDLQLAACLKSPLVGLSEDELLRLAAGRKGSLWRALRDADDLWLRAAAERLSRWRAMADQVAPFRFFARVLGPDGGRRALRARLGGEVDDVLDAFLGQALAYENVEPPSLQGFAAFVRASAGDIKREAEEAGAGVRVMTVHGAKGLEADVVFLVDTGGQVVVPGHRDVLVPVGAGREDPAFLWRRPSKEAPELQRAADRASDDEERREYLRLLYVAMTRARDVLYVAGIRGANPVPDCWYSVVARSLVPESAVPDPQSGELASPYRWPEAARAGVEVPPAAAEPVPEAEVLPDWLHRPAPSPAPAPQPLRPSRALAEPDPRLHLGPAAAGPVAAGEALLRGRALHRLLQLLPTVSGPERERAAMRALGELLADPSARMAVFAEAESVLAHPQLAEAFGPGSRAELAIAGRVATQRGEYAVSGQIDRLVRNDAGWEIIDFKTDRAVPADMGQVAPAAVLQLALYRRLLMEMQPGEVRATLVFTAGPKLMPVPAAAMEQALAKLGIRANPVS
jgi:ATP-dependent helicase/nuclease subunit A